ncbi:MAG: tetratricopeptide repeat protein [Verrucomicrobiota bacterium]
MSHLVISHVVGRGDAPEFVVSNKATGDVLPPVSLPSPYEHVVPNAGGAVLMQELRWQLESFLQYPFSPATDRATRAAVALEDWGTKAFKALFVPHAMGWLPQEAGSVFSITISSDDPHVLSWPWEGLRDYRLGSVLAHRTRIVRKLNRNVAKAPVLSPKLPQDKINILLVTARPREEKDVPFRSIARPLVDLVSDENVPATVELLRPPTFDQLRAHLKANPHRYHILHFDGHGGYGGYEGGAGEFFRGAEGRLSFENKDGGEDAITAASITELLQEHAVPIVVLNACQSAMVDDRAADPFASVAAALLQAGSRSVVAMAYSLYVTGAEAFLPSFYKSLFEDRSLPEAVRVGRQEMLAHPERTSLNSKVRIDDWLVPVVYEQETVELTFGQGGESKEQDGADTAPLPEVVQRPDEYRFVGRDTVLLKLEKALRRRPAGVLIHGLGGIGKTTLAKHLVQWLHDTGGLGKGCLWFAFDEGIHTADYVLNEIGRCLFGMQFDSVHHLEPLVAALKENRLLIVWDNFESVSGIEGTDVKPKLSATDRARLEKFLRDLRGGSTKVVITSRSDEIWLDATICQRVSLGGLRGDEVWDYAAEVLDDLGIKVDRADEKLGEMLGLVGGHPLLLRVVLLELGQKPVAEVHKQLESDLAGVLKAGDPEEHERLLKTLDLVRGSLSEERQRYLVPLSLHEKFADADYVEAMAKAVLGETFKRTNLDDAFGALVPAGLLRDRGQAVFEIHPLLSSYLRSQTSEGTQEELEKWQRAFVNFMGRVADHLAPKQLHEQRGGFGVHGANFHAALALAKELEMNDYVGALTQGLAAYAQNSHDYAEAERLFAACAQHCEDQGDSKAAAAPYHQLGIIAQERRDYEGAEKWYGKSLAIKEKLGDEHGAASTYHQLGRIAEERRDYEGAEKWYGKSLAIKEKQGNEHGAALTYHQLWIIAHERRDYEGAEMWYGKSLAIKEKLGDEHGAASTYHQLGMIAQERRDYEGAEKWYGKSLAISEKLGDEHYAASTYHQLGRIAEERRDYEGAEKWYGKSLAIEEKLGDEHGAASTYHQLGMIAQERRDYEGATASVLSAAEIYNRVSDSHNLGIALGTLSRIFQEVEGEQQKRILEKCSAVLGEKILRQLEEERE